MRIIQSSVSAALALTLAACSGPSEPGNLAEAGGNAGSAAAAIDPCSLVTAEEVSAVVGDKIVAARPGEGRCTYETADAQAAAVTIEVDQKDARNHMQVERDTAKALGRMGGAAAGEGPAGQDVNAMLNDSTDAPGIGDEALFDINSRLSVRKGSVYVAVEPPMMRSRMAGGSPLLSAADKRKMALAIAEKALSRLP